MSNNNGAAQMNKVSMVEWMTELEGGTRLSNMAKYIVREARKEYGVGAEVDVWELHGLFDYAAYMYEGGKVSEADMAELATGVEVVVVD